MYWSSVHYLASLGSVDGVQSVYLSSHVSNEHKAKMVEIEK